MFALNGWSSSRLFNSAIQEIFTDVCYLPVQCDARRSKPLSQETSATRLWGGGRGQACVTVPGVHGVERRGSWRMCVCPHTDSTESLFLFSFVF